MSAPDWPVSGTWRAPAEEVRAARAETWGAAAAEARAIAERFEKQAHGRGGEDRRRALMQASAARLIAFRLTELQNQAALRPDETAAGR
jgi:hypothetical protein